MDQSLTRPSYLFFENKWILEQGFTNLVSGKWQEPKERRPETCYSVDAWHGSLCMIRQFLKGWGIKQAGEKKKSLFCMTYATNFYKSLFGSYDPSHLRPLAPTSRAAEQQQAPTAEARQSSKEAIWRILCLSRHSGWRYKATLSRHWEWRDQRELRLHQVKMQSLLGLGTQWRDRVGLSRQHHWRDRCPGGTTVWPRWRPAMTWPSLSRHMH